MADTTETTNNRNQLRLHIQAAIEHVQEAHRLIEGGWEEILLVENIRTALYDLVIKDTEGKVKP